MYSVFFYRPDNPLLDESKRKNPEIPISGGVKKPCRIRRPWSHIETIALLDAVEIHGEHNWRAVADELGQDGYNRKSDQCSRHYKVKGLGSTLNLTDTVMSSGKHCLSASQDETCDVMAVVAIFFGFFGFFVSALSDTLILFHQHCISQFYQFCFYIYYHSLILSQFQLQSKRSKMLHWILLLILIIVIAMITWRHGGDLLKMSPKGSTNGRGETPFDDISTMFGAFEGGKESDLELFMIRHGQADGETLTELGKEQATKTAEYLKKRFGKKVSDVTIYSSPAQVAVDTAEIIREALKVKEVIVDKCLAEVDRGDGGKDFSKEPELGQKLKDANASFNAEYPDQLDQHKHSDEYFKLLQKTFGGENISQKLKSLREFVDKTKSHTGPVIVISHSGVIGLITPDLVAVSQKGSYLVGDTRHGKNCTITYYQEKAGKPVILVPTNSVHLAS